MPCVTLAMAWSTLSVISVQLAREGEDLAVSICCLKVWRSASSASAPDSHAEVLAGRSFVRSYQSAWPFVSVRYWMNSVAAALCSLSLETTSEEPPAMEVEEASAGTGRWPTCP
ncbi:hypothetical protein GA0115255_113871 [Streptomyces sp. Ncost-T6T-2b]|nr:hypothetical protein GA0115255_113871 [Streptomyces sp. Ncost-T6T-2b]